MGLWDTRPIYWTERSEEHIARHGVTPSEVEEVVFARPQWEAPGRDQSTLIYGTTDSGRHPLVVLVDSVAEPDAWYVATARDMTQSEKTTVRGESEVRTMTQDKIDEVAAYYDEHDTTAELERAVPREPVPADEVMIVTSLRLPKPVMDQVRERAQARGVKPTALIREWVEAALAGQDAVVPISVIMAAVTEYQHKRAS